MRIASAIGAAGARPRYGKPFLLRIDERLMEALKKWADDDLRSLNGQIEFLLRKALQERGRKQRGDNH